MIDRAVMFARLIKLDLMKREREGGRGREGDEEGKREGE